MRSALVACSLVSATIGLVFPRLPDQVDNFSAVAAKIADNRVDLREGNLHDGIIHNLNG